MLFQPGDVAKVKALPWWYRWQGAGLVTEDYIRYMSEGEFGMVVRKQDGSRESYIYGESDMVVWLKAPAIPEPKQQRPAH